MLIVNPLPECNGKGQECMCECPLRNSTGLYDSSIVTRRYFLRRSLISLQLDIEIHSNVILSITLHSLPIGPYQHEHSSANWTIRDPSSLSRDKESSKLLLRDDVPLVFQVSNLSSKKRPLDALAHVFWPPITHQRIPSCQVSFLV